MLAIQGSTIKACLLAAGVWLEWHCDSTAPEPMFCCQHSSSIAEAWVRRPCPVSSFTLAAVAWVTLAVDVPDIGSRVRSDDAPERSVWKPRRSSACSQCSVSIESAALVPIGWSSGSANMPRVKNSHTSTWLLRIKILFRSDTVYKQPRQSLRRR